MIVLWRPLATVLAASTLLQPSLALIIPSQQCAISNSRSSTQLFNLLDDIFDNLDPTKAQNTNNKNGVSKEDSSAQAEINAYQSELFDQSEVLIGLEVARDELKSVLERKQSELEAQQDKWSEEKTSFVAQLAELTSTLNVFKEDNTPTQDDKDAEKATFDEYQLEQERLQREIKLLKNQQNQVEKRLKVERERNEELQTKLSKANDSLEFEQMLFFKDKKSLQAQLEDQKSQLAEIERNLAKDESKSGTDQSSLKSQLQEQKEKLAASQEQIKQLQREYYQEQDVMKQELRQEEKAVRDAQRALEEERRNLQNEKDRMESTLRQERDNLSKMERKLDKEAQEFNDLKPKLEQTFEEEQLRVEQLSRKMQREQDRFDLEKTTLEERIKAEKKRLDMVQGQLSREQGENKQVLGDLSYEQSLIQDQRADDRSRMQERYAALRQAIGSRIEAEKRNGRKDLLALKANLQSTLDDTQGVIDDMQEQVQLEVKSNNKLQGMVKDTRAQTERVYKDKQESEVRYERAIMERKIEIKSLETDIKELKITEDQRGEELERVERSYRAIAKASLKLTGRRLNRVNPLRLLRRGKK